MKESKRTEENYEGAIRKINYERGYETKENYDCAKEIKKSISKGVLKYDQQLSRES